MRDETMQLLRSLDPQRDGDVGAPAIGRLLALAGAEHGSVVRRRRRAPRSPIAVAVAVACLAAFAVAAVIVRSGDNMRHDAFIPAAGKEPVIVHVVSRTTMELAGGRRGGATMGRIGTMDGPVERWSATDPVRWRQRMTLLPQRGMPGGTIDTVYADGVSRTHESWRRGVRTMRLPAGGRLDPALVLGGGIGSGGRALIAGVADPHSVVQGMLDSGEVQDAGETSRDGRRLRELIGETDARRTGRNSFQPASRTSYLVDAVTYVPVEVVSMLDLAARRRAGERPVFRNATRTVFDTYETLPLDARAAQFLRLAGR
jgi:hypothetical protein